MTFGQIGELLQQSFREHIKEGAVGKRPFFQIAITTLK